MATNITPLPVRFELRAYGQIYDVSNFIENWREIEVTLKRDGLSGVFHKISLPFKFVLDGYDIVKSIFDSELYAAVADIYLYIRRDDWIYSVDKYGTPEIFNLDFTTYKKSDTVIELETRRVSLYDFLKSKGKLVYDIPVNEIKAIWNWKFDRIPLENMVMFRCVAGGYFVADPLGSVSFGISDEKTEINVKDSIYIKTIGEFEKFQPNSYGRDENSQFMFRNPSKNVSIVINYELDINGTVTPNYSGGVFYSTWRLVFRNGIFVERSYTITPSLLPNVFWKTSGSFVLPPNEGCYLLLQNMDSINNVAGCGAWLNGTLTVQYNDINEPVNIDVFNPKTLLKNLVDKMTDTTGVYQTDIDDFNTSNNDMIMMCAAESIRGIEPDPAVSSGVQVHTSYNQFLQWMNVFGYEEHISEDSLILKKRGNSFRSDLIAIELDEEDTADLIESVDDKYLWSGVKIGYSRKEIEGLNGKFEFNGQHDYATELTVVDNVLELISPYRADCYGIEFLAQERNKDTKEYKSDKDLFLVHVRQQTEIDNNFDPPLYSIYFKAILTQNLSGNIPDTAKYSLFNGSINPYNLLLKNLDLVAVSVKALKFTASDSNAEIVIDSIPLNSDCTVPANIGIFDPILYDIASRNVKHLPEGDERNGLVKFIYKGDLYEGFIDEISKNPAWEAETTWKLRKKKIN